MTSVVCLEGRKTYLFMFPMIERRIARPTCVPMLRAAEEAKLVMARSVAEGRDDVRVGAGALSRAGARSRGGVGSTRVCSQGPLFGTEPPRGVACGASAFFCSNS